MSVIEILRHQGELERGPRHFGAFIWMKSKSGRPLRREHPRQMSEAEQFQHARCTVGEFKDAYTPQQVNEFIGRSAREVRRFRELARFSTEAADQQGVAVCAIDTQHVDLGPACGGEDDLPDAQQRRSFSHAKKI